MNIYNCNAIDICSSEEKGWNCVHIAASSKDSLLSLEFILKRCFRQDPYTYTNAINSLTIKEGWTPLMIATALGNTEIIK